MGEKIIPVQCDQGTQRIRWLANVGIARFDDNSGISLGVPRGVQDEVGQLLDLNALISSLKNEEHVWVLLKGEFCPMIRRFLFHLFFLTRNNINHLHLEDDESSAMIPKDLCW